ncbi:MAG: YdcF family protein [Bacteroidetes bacterium]|nr:YdcF family protein [Bacteroidota bacterium]
MKPLSLLRKSFRITLFSFGAIALFFIILALTTAPFHLWYRLSNSKAAIHQQPEYIIVLGGGGMPSETGLIRCWYAAKAASYFQQAKIIIALPGDTADSLSSVNGMKKELVLRGIKPERIFLEDSGTNTRAQALNIASSRVTRHASLLIVTSPEHLVRAVLTFKKAGFTKVDGIPAFEEAIESDITFEGKLLGGRKWVPNIGENLTIRYEFWTQLRYEELLLREYFAIAYYWVKGWI